MRSLGAGAWGRGAWDIENQTDGVHEDRFSRSSMRSLHPDLWTWHVLAWPGRLFPRVISPVSESKGLFIPLNSASVRAPYSRPSRHVRLTRTARSRLTSAIRLDSVRPIQQLTRKKTTLGPGVDLAPAQQTRASGPSAKMNHGRAVLGREKHA